MLLEAGDKLLVVHRRLFEGDRDRFFVGSVDAYDDGIARVSGYSFARDLTRGDLVAKSQLRTKLVPLTSGAFLVYQLPPNTEVESVHFVDHGTGLILTDGGEVRMDLTESPHDGRL